MTSGPNPDLNRMLECNGLGVAAHRVLIQGIGSVTSRVAEVIKVQKRLGEHHFIEHLIISGNAKYLSQRPLIDPKEPPLSACKSTHSEGANALLESALVRLAAPNIIVHHQ